MQLESGTAGIGKGLDYVESELKRYGLKPKAVHEAMLAAEESMIMLCDNAEGEKPTEIVIRKRFGAVTIKLISYGREFNPAENLSMGISLDTDDMDTEAEMTIRGMVLRSFSDRLKYKYVNHRSVITILAKKHEKNALWITLGALVVSVLLGLLLRAVCPADFLSGLDEWALDPLKTMFLNALKMVVVPVVFFSIASCVSNFGSFAELGKIGAKVMGFYMVTTVFAIAVGIGVFYLFTPGSSVTPIEATSAVTSEVAEISILDTIVDIVPTNFIQAFLDANMLQVIFIALISGAAVGMIGDYSKPLKDLFEACNALFLKITTLIIKLIPLAVFCSMMSLVITTGAKTLLSLLGLMGTIIVGMTAMVAIYCVMIALFGRVNPIIFLKKNFPAFLTTFSLSSSSAAMPYNMQTCREKLGISNRIVSFSIPLGATINMDGSCVYLAVSGLFLAQLYGVALTPTDMLAMIFSIFVLSIGAPGIPGAAFVCLSVLLVQIGVPVEAVGLIMGIDAILSMCRSASNSVGDSAISLIVARQEKLLDMDVYNSK